jgi:hypothetical protein
MAKAKRQTPDVEIAVDRAGWGLMAARQEDEMAGSLAPMWAAIRKNGPGYGLEILVNGVLPFVIYMAADKQLGDVGALIASSVPPIAWSVYQFVHSRRVDALSLLIITGIILSMLALLGGGGAKFLQLRENLVTGVIGMIFLGSVLFGRPLIYYLARAGIMRNTPDEAESFDAMRDSAVFKHTMLVLTLVWGFGLVTVLYVRRRRRIGDAFRAAAAEAAAQAAAAEAIPPQ